MTQLQRTRACVIFSCRIYNNNYNDDDDDDVYNYNIYADDYNVAYYMYMHNVAI